MEHTPPQSKAEQADRHDLLRDLILEAALEVLDRRGLDLQPDAVAYARVFAHLHENYGVRIGRGSVHGRIWGSQEEYRLEVLAATAQYSSLNDRTLQRAALEAFAAQRNPYSHPRERVLAFCRVTARALLQSTLDSDVFRRSQAIKAVARGAGRNGDPDATGEKANVVLQAAVRNSAQGTGSERMEGLRFIVDALGLRPRPALGLDDGQAIDLFVTMVQTLITGAHLDNHAGFAATASKVETAMAADEEHPWTYFSVGFLAFMDFVFEPDPAADVASGAAVDFAAIPVSNEAASNEDPPDLSSLIGSRPRRRRHDLRKLVVAAGVELLLRDGVALRAESITYARVFDHIKHTRGITVNRSTVHPHIWTSQSEFRGDVLAEAARYDTCESLSTMRQAMAAQTVTRNPDHSVNLRQLILDNSRAMMTAQMTVAATSPTFRRWQLTKAFTLSAEPSEGIDRVRQAVRDGYGEMIHTVIDTYRSVLPLVNLDVNPELEMSEDQAYHLFAVICATLCAGADFDIGGGALPAGRVVALPRADSSGDIDDWPLPAAAALATLDLLFTPRTADV